MEKLYHSRKYSAWKKLHIHKIHKQENPVRLLTTGCNTAIENLSRFIENDCFVQVIN